MRKLKIALPVLLTAFAFSLAMLPQSALAIEDGIEASNNSAPEQVVTDFQPADDPGSPESDATVPIAGNEQGGAQSQVPDNENPNPEPDAIAPADGEKLPQEANVANENATIGDNGNDDLLQPENETTADAVASPVSDDGTSNSEEEGSAEPPAQPQSATAASPENGATEATGNAVMMETAESPKATPAATAASAKPAASSTTKKAANAKEADAPKASIRYSAFVQNGTWQSYASNGAFVGTTGKSLRLEGLKIYLTDANGKKISGDKGGVQYQVHMQNSGWQAVKANNAAVGAAGKGLRIEGIRIKLTGDISRYYDVVYRAYVQNLGNKQGWVKNGAMAGTSGKGYRIEGIEVKLVEKPKKQGATDGLVGVRYRTHVQNVGWQAQVQNGTIAGTSGRSLRVEAVNIYLDKGVYTGGIEYQAHVQNVGWQDMKSNGQMAGTSGKSLRVEAFRIKLTGDIAKNYDVVYRTHVQNVGWQNWVLNGQTAGTSGKSLRVEALQIRLVKKGSNQVISEGTYFIGSAANPNVAADVPNATKKPGTQINAHTTNYSNAQRFYIRNEGSGTYSIQSVASGLFLAEKGGKVVQTSDSSAATHRWKATWNGGYSLVNASTGKEISLSGDKKTSGTPIVDSATAKKSTHRWTLTSTSLIASGTYAINNVASGNVLDVSNASWEDGANVMVCKANGGGNQAFTVKDTGSDVYRITCAMTGKAVATKGTNVQQGGSGSAALWQATFDRKGNIVFVNKASGKALNATGKASGSNVNTAKKSGAATQQWTLKPTTYKPDPVLQRAMSKANSRSSNTKYFIAVDLTNNRTVVFSGKKGNWTPIKNWTVSTGSPSTPTVVGDFTVGIRGYSFGSGYTCYYYTQFYGDYLFHSVLYNQGTRTIQDGRLGKSISHGCVRMNINDAKWIYDNIPAGTHVKTYY